MNFYIQYKDLFHVAGITGGYITAALTITDLVLKVLIGMGTLYLIWKKIKKVNKK